MQTSGDACILRTILEPKQLACAAPQHSRSLQRGCSSRTFMPCAQDCGPHPAQGPSQYAYFAVATTPAKKEVDSAERSEMDHNDSADKSKMDHIYLLAHTAAEGTRVIAQLHVIDRVTALCHYRHVAPSAHRLC